MAYTCPDIQGFKISGGASITNTRYYDDSAGNYYAKGATLPTIGNGDYLEFYVNGSWDVPWFEYISTTSGGRPAGWSLANECEFVFQLPSSVNGKNVTSIGYTDGGAYEGSASISSYPYTIPSTVKFMPRMFKGQTNLTGLIKVDANPTTYTNWLQGTTKAIKLTGQSTMLSTLASGYSNVSVLLQPNISVLAQRCDSLGNLDDEGTYASITIYITADPVNTSYDIDIAVNGTTAYTASNVTVSSTAEEQKTYVIGGAYDATLNYDIEVTVADSWSVYTVSATDTLSTAFYTIDVGNAGHEVVFGGPANDVLAGTDATNGLFKCNMNAKFNGDVHLWSGDSPIGLSDIVVETYDYTYSNISSGGVINWQETVTKSGYYPIGCVSFNANRSGLYVDRAEVTNRASGSCDIWLHARAGSAVNGNTAHMDILWIKEN